MEKSGYRPGSPDQTGQSVFNCKPITRGSVEEKILALQKKNWRRWYSGGEKSPAKELAKIWNSVPFVDFSSENAEKVVRRLEDQANSRCAGGYRSSFLA
ncbi:MAG: hypothetical protein U0105_03510 [Candidatus Obscuribacterales bacterium]